MQRTTRTATSVSERTCRERHLDFLIVGAPKCGTTAIHAHLRKHPEIFLPERKELHYYGSDLKLLSKMSDADHWNLFQQAPANALRGETGIWALYSKTAAREISAAHPEAKILIFLRHPVEMVRAMHAEFLLGDVENIRSFRKAWDIQGERRQGKRLSHTMEPPQLLIYESVASFCHQVERYFEAFPFKQVHVILQEELRSDPSRTIAGIHKFLGVEPSYFENFEVINPAKKIRSVWLKKQMRNPNSSLSKGCCRLIKSADLRNRLWTKLDKWNIFPCKREPMDPKFYNELWQVFEADVARLSRLLGRDLSVWTQRK